MKKRASILVVRFLMKCPEKNFEEIYIEEREEGMSLWTTGSFNFLTFKFFSSIPRIPQCHKIW